VVIEFIDVRTLILILILGHAIAALLLFFATRRRAQIYDTIFMISMALQAAGWFFLFFRGVISDILSFSFGDTLLFSGFCLETIAFLSLVRPVDKRWQRTYTVIFALSIITIWLPLLGHDLAIGIVSILNALFFIFPSYLLVFSTPRSTPLKQFTGCILLLNVIAGISRGSYLLVVKNYSLLEPTFIQVLFLFTHFIIMALASTSYILIRWESLSADLEDEIAERRVIEGELKEKTDSLQERVKELNCLYDIAHLIETTTFGDALLQALVNILPAGWRYPALTCARITVGSREFQSEGFQTSAIKQESTLTVYGKNVGNIEIFFLGDEALYGTDPFLAEELNLIFIVAERISRVLERHQSEEAHRESEERYRQLYDSMMDAFACVDMSGRITLFNESFRQMVGYEPAEIYTLTYNDLTPEKWHAKEADIIENQVFRRGYSDIFEKEYRRKDGTVFPLEIRTFLMKDTTGNNKGMWAIVRDITEQKKAKEALKTANQFLDTTIDSIPGVFFVFEENGHFVRRNINHRIITGYSDEELQEITPLDVIAPEDRDFVAEIINRVFSQEEFTTITVSILTKDGRKIPYLLGGLSMTVAGKKYLVGTGIDITEQVQAEEALRKSEARYHNLIDTSHDIIYSLSEEGIFLFVSPAWTHLLGHPLSEVSGHNFTEFVHPDDLPVCYAFIHKVLETGERQEGVEYRVKHKNGEWRWHTSSGTPILDDVGGITRYTGIAHDITNRKKTEEELFHSKQMLQLVIDTIPLGVFWKDRNSIYLGCNLSHARDAGYSDPRDIVGKDDYSTTWNEIADKYRADDRKVMETGIAQLNYEEPLIKPDGSRAWVTTSKVPLRGRRGEVIGLLGTYEDITSRKQMEQALRKSEELLRLFIEHAPAALAMLDRELRYVAVSHRWLSDYHLGDRDIIGHTHPEIFPELQKEILAVLYRSLLGEVISSKEDKFVRLDGAVQWLAWEVRPWYTSDQNIGGIIIFSEDITGRKQAEEALRQSEEKYRVIIENIPDFVYQADLEGKFIMINPSGLRMLGYDSMDQITGRPATDVYENPDDRKPFLEALRKNGSVHGYPVTIKTNNGTIRHVTVSSHYFYDTNGTIAGVEGVVHDLTDLHRAEASLRMANQKLNLLSSITRHDINNQLQALTGYIHLSTISFEDPKTLAGYFAKEEVIAENIRRQISFSKDYEDLGVKSAVWQDVSLLIKDVSSGLLMQDLQLIIDCPGLEIFADPLLYKVFYNLTDNALHYGGEKMTTIRLSANPQKDHLLLIFEDDGEGVSMEDKPKLFTRGFGKNTGLGLFLSREILAITGLMITENGEPGTGARFEITIPNGKWRFTNGD